ncbi:MAG TPA: AraC family transcriptional regulator [Clostridiales bacterium]|nr:AraC family transcriptional regulator [Clostridiales bacterium]
MNHYEQFDRFVRDTMDQSVPDRLKISLPLTLYYKIIQDGFVSNFTVYPGGVGYVPGTDFGMKHRHDHFEFIYVLEGNCTNRIEDVSYQYKKGDACLLNRNTFHSDSPANNSSVVFINFSGDYISSILEGDIVHARDSRQQLVSSPVRQFLQSNLHGEERFAKNYMEFTSTLQALSQQEAHPLEQIISQIQLELVEQKPGCSFLINGLVSRLFHTIENPVKYHTNLMKLDSSNEEFLLARITNYLKESNGRISRAELSRVLNYNAEYLNQIVKRRTGMSIMQLGKSYLLDSAKLQLTGSDKSVSDIISELGFASTSHFYELFQKGVGMSPKEFRDRHKADARSLKN